MVIRMAFASIFAPNFMMQAVVRSEPTLRDRAIALVDGSPSIQTIISLNEMASKAGVKLAMTKFQVQPFFDIEVRPRSRMQEKIAHAALLDLGWSVSPRIEDTAVDTIALDLDGLASLFGSVENIAGQLAEGAKRLGFITQIATASNLDAAILASRALPGITVIPASSELTTIGKVPLSALSASTEVFETLERWGVRTCAALAALPVLQLSERLGQEGVRLHELARARSTRAMVLAQPAAYFEEEMELEPAITEIEPLSFLVGRLLDQLCVRLTARSLSASAIRVRFQLEGSNEKEVRLQKNNACQEPGANIYERTFSLPLPIRDSKMLLKLLILHWQSDGPSAPILKINLAAEAARPRVSQGGLFSLISPDPEKVELTIARLANLVGDSNIGSPELLDTHRSEGFRMRRFLPSRDSSETRHPIRRSPGGKNTAVTEKGENLKEDGFKTAFRVFRPALPAKVEARKGCPARVAFQNIRGRVVAASGPWRSSGDWWTEDAWQSEEWDIEIHFDVFSNSGSREQIADTGARRGLRGGVYRLFCDLTRKEWFVRGAYD